MQKLSSHQRQGAGRPSPAAVRKYVVTDMSPDGHWEWAVSGRERRFNRHGHAVWAVRLESWQRVSLFVVARLLLDDVRGPYGLKASFASQCGVAGCVNPHHWEQVLIMPSVRIQPWLGGWAPIVIRTGKMVRFNVPLVVRCDNAASHILIAESKVVQTFRTVCGLEVYPANTVVLPRGVQVTCKGCL